MFVRKNGLWLSFENKCRIKARIWKYNPLKKNGQGTAHVEQQTLNIAAKSNQSGWDARIIFINTGSWGGGRILKTVLSLLLCSSWEDTAQTHSEARLWISFYNEPCSSILKSSLINEGWDTLIIDTAFLVFISTFSLQTWHLTRGMRCLSLEISQWSSERHTANGAY